MVMRVDTAAHRPIAKTPDAPPAATAASTAQPPGALGQCLGAASGAPPAVQGANRRALAEVHRLLSPRAEAPAALGRLLAHFQTLVAADGPLPFVRFAPDAFAAALRRHARDAAAGVLAAASTPAVADACLAELALDAGDNLRGLVQDFVAQAFVPADDRLAAVAALATWGLGEPVPLALHAVFAAQLGESVGRGAHPGEG